MTLTFLNGNKGKTANKRTIKQFLFKAIFSIKSAKVIWFYYLNSKFVFIDSDDTLFLPFDTYFILVLLQFKTFVFNF